MTGAAASAPRVQLIPMSLLLLCTHVGRFGPPAGSRDSGLSEACGEPDVRAWSKESQGRSEASGEPYILWSLRSCNRSWTACHLRRSTAWCLCFKLLLLDHLLRRRAQWGLAGLQPHAQSPLPLRLYLEDSIAAGGYALARSDPHAAMLRSATQRRCLLLSLSLLSRGDLRILRRFSASALRIVTHTMRIDNSNNCSSCSSKDGLR